MEKIADAQVETRYQRTTREQLRFYVDFCKTHPELHARKHSQHDREVAQELWEKIAERLNTMRGPMRSAEKWKDTLGHWKSQLRSRSRKERRKLKMNDGDVHKSPLYPGEFEQMVIQSFGSASVDSAQSVTPAHKEQTLFARISGINSEQEPYSRCDTFRVDKQTSTQNDYSSLDEDSSYTLLSPLTSPASSPPPSEEDVWRAKMSQPHANNSNLPSKRFEDALITQQTQLHTAIQQIIKVQERSLAQQEKMAGELEKIARGLVAIGQAIEKFAKK